MRYPIIDAIRGTALVGMMIFHANYMLEEVFGVMNFHFSDQFWFLLGRGVAIIFIIVAGVSFSLSIKNKTSIQILVGTFRRFFLLAGLAGIISIVTFSIMYEQRISFGIIHFFAFASICSLLFLRLEKLSIILGVGIIFLGKYLATLITDVTYLFPLGITASTYFSADYYPLFPWFGYYLIGYGSAYYLTKYGVFDRFFSSSIPGTKILEFFGRNSLLVYSIHVPIIYVILFFIFLR
ncbi:DUF1624 domain-containing protein [Candidatus Gracilibacteria bacterium]|nr:DUF1624 domain-containing protein [Candidatus Gracilibacteria bacterium]